MSMVSVWWKRGGRRRPAADHNAGRPWPKSLKDCRALLVASAGESPRAVLADARHPGRS